MVVKKAVLIWNAMGLHEFITSDGEVTTIIIRRQLEIWSQKIISLLPKGMLLQKIIRISMVL